MGISVVIITKNEEKNITRCLESVVWAEEVIIVDDFSSDRTLDLASQFKNVKIYKRKFDRYSWQKNFGIDKSTNEWVLSLDADEVVTKELSLEILKIVKEGSEFVAFKIPRRLVFLGKFLKGGKTYPDYQLRLFKQKFRFDDSIVHEKLVIHGKIGRVKSPIVHYSYPDLETYLVKLNLYSSLYAERKLSEGKKSCFGIFYFPAEFFYRYILRLGFLDGFEGFLWCFLSSFHTFVKNVKVWEKINSKAKIPQSIN